ncbi:hypothetical protein TrLO_g13266 [Triparma laevis f. longispina]|uniref:Uncharacterized protein n=1 Tax=Triparma laevis f. longispina TaxID=1714387 RepID=A0A9W7E7E7_9STRA|nr:hypothetical protein TrLO_g13266 [Triparma laevis f. longispina]
MFALLAGIYDSTIPPPMVILFLGLDNSGKTSTLESLKQLHSTPGPKIPLNMIRPTLGVNNSTLVVNKRSITVYDPAGRVEGRRMWSGYYAESHGILYVVEGHGEPSAGARLEESQLVFSTVSSSMPNKPIAIFVNCPDLERRSEIGKLVTEYFKIYLYEGRVKVFLGDVKSGYDGKMEGAGEAIDWLVKMETLAMFTKINDETT